MARCASLGWAERAGLEWAGVGGWLHGGAGQLDRLQLLFKRYTLAAWLVVALIIVFALLWSRRSRAE